MADEQPLDTSVRYEAEESEVMTPAQWDAFWVTDWLASKAYDNPPPPSADQALDYAHHNPDAWPLIELPGDMDGTQAWQLLETATELTVALAERFNKYHGKDGKFASKTGGGGGVGVIDRPVPKQSRPAASKPKRQNITAAEARGNSRPVSQKEFDRIADEGDRMLAQRERNRKPLSHLDDERSWTNIKDDAYIEAQKSWGGATIDSHTGVPLHSKADKYALTIKQPGQETVSVPENAKPHEFHAAMDQAKERFRTQLEYEGSHLGVFHDDETHRIDIDPVMVVSTLHEVETIGAATHAIGGAYHFKSGDGFWPPHVAEGGGRSRTIGLGDEVHWKGPGEWLTYCRQHQGTGEGSRALYGRLRKPDGGFTYDTRADRDVTHGFVVAAFPERSWRTTADRLTPADIEDYARRNVDLLDQPGHMLGGWHDPETGEVWLDVSVVTSNRAKALKLAQDHDQIAIFDLSKFESIPAGGSGAA